MAHWKRSSTHWWQLAVVVIMMLAAIGAWEIVKGMAKLGGYAQADGFTPDHLTCYDVTPSSVANVTIQLKDQFYPGGIDAVVRNLRLLCTPALKACPTGPSGVPDCTAQR